MGRCKVSGACIDPLSDISMCIGGLVVLVGMLWQGWGITDITLSLHNQSTVHNKGVGFFFDN